MDVERAKIFAGIVAQGNGTLKKAALSEALETLLTEIERLEKPEVKTERLEKPEVKTEPIGFRV